MKDIIQIIKLVLVVSMLFLLPVAVSAADITVKNADGKNINYDIISENEVEIAQYGDYTGDLRIPATVDYKSKTYKVTAVSRSAFYLCKELISVELPDAITSIGVLAFQNCEKLESVNIPASLVTIGESAFSFCTKLKLRGDFLSLPH